MSEKIYLIENEIDERRTAITGYFLSFAEAKRALKKCNDWYSPKGTGRIYSVKCGLYPYMKLEYEGRPVSRDAR